MRVNTLLPLKLILAVICIILLTACDKEDQKSKHNKEMTVRIASVKTIMTGGVTHRPYFARVDGSSDWQCFDDISGFEFQEGHEYELRIWQEKWHDGEIMDASIYRYKLLEVLSDIEKDTPDIPIQYVYAKIAPEKSLAGNFYVCFPDRQEEVREISNFDYEAGYAYSIGMYVTYHGKDATPTYTYTWEQTFDKKEKECTP